MDYLAFLKNLRTRREMKPTKISYEDLEEVINNVSYAASARNIKPLRYVLITEPTNVKDVYLKTNLSKTHNISGNEAPSAFIIIGTENEYPLPELTLGMDVGIACQIIRESLLYKGLSSVPINLFNHEQIKELINDENFRALHCIAIGKSDMEVKIYEGKHDPEYFFDEEDIFTIAKLGVDELIKAKK